VRKIHLSIRGLVALIVIAPIVVVSVTLVMLSVVTSRRIAENLGHAFVDNVTARVSAEVRDYLGDAVRISDLYMRRIADGVLPTTGLPAWERPMLDDLLSSKVASICFGNEAGDATWVLHGRGRLEAGRVVGGQNDRAPEHEISFSGAVDPVPFLVHHYDPRERPWYQSATKSPAALWTPVYSWFAGNGADALTGSGYARAVRDASGKVAGVLVVDVTLGALSDFLRTLPVTRGGYAFIIDENDLLIAASEGGVNSATGERLSLANSPSNAARAVAPQLLDVSPGTMVESTIDDKPVRALATLLHPYPGIQWRLVSIVPEAAFLSDTNAAQNRAVLLAICTILVSVFLGVRLSRKLTRPMLALTGHVRRVGAGDFSSRLNLTAVAEFEHLSDELNRMAHGLKQRTEFEKSLGLAMEVQQSLLPRRLPKVPHLDIAGQSRYCDATGGDYYDYIVLPEARCGDLIFAIGDVTGHGIASALLMATARAAVRGGAMDAKSLGDLMTRVNAVLAKDATHERFMTMTLLTLDPEKRCVRWASAGHDPVIVYDPAANTFRELSDGSIPLGLFEDATYEEYGVDRLTPGSILLMGTDGIWEARGANREMFGKERLRDEIRKRFRASASDIAAGIDRALSEWVGSQHIQDDVTFMVLKMH